jgi:hypothetical protein
MMAGILSGPAKGIRPDGLLCMKEEKKKEKEKI